MLILSIGASVITISVLHFYGVRDVDGISMTSKAAIYMMLICNSIAALVFITMRNIISLLFTTKAEVMALAPEILIMLDCFLVIESLLCTSIGIMRGIQDVKIISFIPLLAYLVQNIHIGYLSGFVFDLGHSGLFVGYLLGFGTAATLYLMMNKYKIREFGKTQTL